MAAININQIRRQIERMAALTGTDNDEPDLVIHVAFLDPATRTETSGFDVRGPGGGGTAPRGKTEEFK